MTSRGSNSDSNLSSAAPVQPDQQVGKFYLLWIPWMKCVDFEFVLGLLKIISTKIEDSCELIPTLIP